MNSFDPFISTQYRKQSKDETFNDEEPKSNQKSDSQYLSQILSSCFNGTSKQITEHTQIDHIAEKHIQQENSEENSFLQGRFFNSKRKSNKNSPFHNFQKHLVITLRQILSSKPLPLKVGFQNELAAEIFEHFKKSQKTSRSFLEQVFGLFQNRDSTSKASFMRSLRSGQLSAILEQHDDETIYKAQQVLKIFVKIQLDECEIQECLLRRKIQKKPEFIEYINLFKRQLVEGKQRKKTYKLLAQKFQKPTIKIHLNNEQVPFR